MKLFGWRWLVISSAIAVSLAGAETRPRYGGTLRISMRAAPTSLDPADNTQPDSFDRRNLALLIFETLVYNDDNGRLRPGLAVSWQASTGDQRWQFRLRPGVKFHDGTTLTPEIAAASLRTANPSWKVSVTADSLVVERDAPDPELPAELALSRNAVVKRNQDNKMSGTGPFHIVDWQSGKKLVLAAEENYWRGRPFLDGVEVELGKSSHDSQIALELGRTDLIKVAPEQSHGVSGDGRRVSSSSPMELVALLFARDAQSPEEKQLREALALSVDRASMRNVLLQGAGQPAGGILPSWLSGYGFVFPVDADLSRARQVRDQLRSAPAWTVGYDAGDPIARLLVERIALNAHDAGLTLQPKAASDADLRLMRIPLSSTDPWISMDDIATAAGLPQPRTTGGSVEELYSAEQTILGARKLIPLFHLPVTYAASAALKNWSPRQDGTWNLADAWLGSEKP